MGTKIGLDNCPVCGAQLYGLPPDPWCGGGGLLSLDRPKRCVGWAAHVHPFFGMSQFCDLCGEAAWTKAHEQNVEGQAMATEDGPGEGS